jgi:hypothetical protein
MLDQYCTFWVPRQRNIDKTISRIGWPIGESRENNGAVDEEET